MGRQEATPSPAWALPVRRNIHARGQGLRRGGATRGSSRLPCSGQQFPCFLPQNSLFNSLGKLRRRRWGIEISKAVQTRDGLGFANFPVFFPVSREFGAETGSHWTASSANFSFEELDTWRFRRRSPAPSSCRIMLQIFSKQFQGSPIFASGSTQHERDMEHNRMGPI